MKKVVVLLGLVLLTNLDSNAVIVAGGDGTQNTTVPTGGQGWDYVGRISNKPSSVTYLTNNWFITANHIKQLDNPTGVIFDGNSYSINASSWTRLTNTDGSDADLMMFRVAGTVGVSALTVMEASPANGTDVTMIGNGFNRNANETWWDYNWNETTTSYLASHKGYKWVTGTTKRWGSNTKDADAGLVDDGYGITDMFYTDFDNISGEAQGATYDSGGGVFANVGGEWQLAGIMLTVSTASGQPASTSVYENRTYIADLSTYATQINTTAMIPEPSVMALGFFLLPVVFFIRRTFLI